LVAGVRESDSLTAPGIAYIRTHHAKPPASYSVSRLCIQAFRFRTMTDEQLAAMHRLLAEYHRRLAKEAVLDVVQQYHADLAQRFADEAALIPRRTAIVERLHEREQQKKDDGE
jgi:hypothetical protein